MNMLKVQSKIYLGYIWIIIFCIFAYGVGKVCCFSLFPDEFGYWTGAANAIGYDWTEIASLGSYYSFGYGIVLTPILKFAPDGIAAYRMAIALNMILLCISVVLLSGIIKQLFPEREEVSRVFIAGVAALYPAWTFYMQMTLAEAYILFLFVLLFRMFLALIDKPNYWKAVIVSVLSVYVYCVHMRTLGITMACAITLIVWGVKKKEARKYVFVFLIVFACMGIGAVIWKQYAMEHIFIYSDAGRLATNDFQGVWIKIQKMFSPSGILHFLVGITGKIFYLCIATFGMFFFAWKWCLEQVKNGIDVLRKKQSAGEEFFTAKALGALFLILAVVSEVLLCTVYMVHENNIDSLVYGRYLEVLVPVSIVIGICVIPSHDRIRNTYLRYGFYTAVMSLFLYGVIILEKRTGFRGFMAVGLSYFVREEKMDSPFTFGLTWLFCMLMLGVIIGIMHIIREKMEYAWLFGIVLTVEVVLGIVLSHRYTYYFNETNFYDKVIADIVLENLETNDTIVYLKEDGSKYIDSIQMMLGEHPIKMLLEEEIADNEDLHSDFLITTRWTEYRQELEQLYKRCVETKTFILYYN